MNKVFKFLRESRDEFRQVSWPTRDEVTSFTGVVLVAVIIIATFLWLIDTGLMSLIKTTM